MNEALDGAEKVAARSHPARWLHAVVSAAKPSLLLIAVLTPDSAGAQDCVGTNPFVLGSVVELPEACPEGSGTIPNTTCRWIEVFCEGMRPVRAQVRITEPAPGVADRGTVLLGSGGSGTSFYPGSEELVNDLANLGFRVADRAWAEPNGWITAEVGLRRQACRYATLLSWLHDNVHTGGALVASGNSLGSAEIGYALTSWGMDSILDLAVPTSGPALARLDYVCPNPAPPEWQALCLTIVPPGALDCPDGLECSLSNIEACYECSSAPTPEDLRADSVAHVGAVFDYPTTKVHFLFGQYDCSRAVPGGLNWANSVTSEKAIEFVPRTPHDMVSTPEGRTAILRAIDEGTLTTTITEFQIPTAGSQPHRITAGPDGSVWFTEHNPGSPGIGRITPEGVITEFVIPHPSSRPLQITTGPDGNLWFTEMDANQIGRVTPFGSFTEFPIPTPNSLPGGIATGPDGALWFTEHYGNKIGRITTSGVITEFVVPTSSLLEAIVAGPDGALWFAERSANKIGRITTSGAITEFPIPTSSSEPIFIAAGPDGALWFGEWRANQIGRITTSGEITEFSIPTPGSRPHDIVGGLDGNLYFVESRGNKIGRITTSGTITEFPIPTPTAQAQGIALGPDGAIWFTEVFGNKIGRLSLSSLPCEPETTPCLADRLPPVLTTPREGKPGVVQPRD